MPPPPARSPWSYLGLGVEMALPLVLFIYAGHKLDGWLGTDPWLFLGGALLGIAVSFYGFVRSVLPPADGQDGKAE